ncbi:hypothetical protein tb265_40630 [Gemmatimonadetes bacterium T265]|nr:hypothetical protein tb265_40630 [Gemmatimonadetes bacterium T265]
MSRMSPQATSQLVRAAALAWALYGLAVRGYRTHRGTWGRAAWRRFAALLAAWVVVGAVGMSMATSVDLRIYDRYGFSPGARRAYASVLVTLAILGAAGVVRTLLWFAKSRPEAEVRWPVWVRRQRGAG